MATDPSSSCEAVLFDLDGTLADTVGLILLSYRHTMEHHLGTAPPDADWIAGMGRPLRDQLVEFASTSDEAQSMLETYVSFQRTVHDEMVQPYPGVVELVESLAEDGRPIAVVTSKRREMARRTLKCCGLEQHFDLVIGGDDVERGKPHPAAVFAALEAMAVVPSRQVLFVGDSPYDVQAGNAAGVSTVAALWGPFERDVVTSAGPHHVAETPAAVATLVLREGRRS